MSAQAKTATIVETLVDFDGPQLLLLNSSRNRNMFGLAVERDGMKQPFFGCEVPDRVSEAYFDQTTDLHYAFKKALALYFFDLAVASDETVPLVPAKVSEVSNDTFWPEVGLFARTHTSAHKRPKVVSSTKSFKIDGKWAADDFSHFHAKIADLYALFGVLQRLDGAHKDVERGFIRETIHERFWQGGGSYSGFYGSLMARNRHLQLNPLEVASIRYSSPGHIDLRGNNKALTEIVEIMDVFDRRAEELQGLYRAIHGLLGKQELLSAKPTTPFASKAQERFVETKSREFAAKMGVEKIDDVFAACGNVLVFAKLILSIYRRANELYRFHAEGRIQSA